MFTNIPNCAPPMSAFVVVLVSPTRSPWLQWRQNRFPLHGQLFICRRYAKLISKHYAYADDWFET